MAEERLIRLEEIERSVLRLRGQNVMLDADLAALYQVDTKALEFHNLRRQFGTSRSWGGRRYQPYAFAEQGVAMLSSVLRSRRAARTNVEIMRVFIRLRRMVESQAELSKKLDALERRYDSQFSDVFRAIRELMAPPSSARKRIGFSL